MTKLIWNASGDRIYETGIEKAVLYIDGQPPVKWTGLISVSVAPTGGEIEPLYYDGRKFSNNIAKQEYKSSVKAFSIPEEFNSCVGVKIFEHQGLFASNQALDTFNLSYKTLVGNDIDGINNGYKIHLIYNASAIRSDINYNSISKNTTPNQLSLTLTATAPVFNGKAVSPYKVIDSRNFTNEQISDLEDFLYGTDDAFPKFPTQSELINLLGGIYV
jgi:hypothetical protein